MSTSALRRQFKINGQIGEPEQKDKISFSSLAHQIQTGLTQGYTENEIVDGVIHSITPGYLETYKDLTLDWLKKTLRSHYGVKNTSELYQTLASPQAFLMNALDLRQQIMFACSDENDDTSLQYDSGHIQRLFLRSVETGLQDESIRTKIRPFLKDPHVTDEVLIHQMSVAASAEKERDKKLKDNNKSKSPAASVTLVSDSAKEKQVNKEQSDLVAAINAIKSEVEALKGEVRKKDNKSCVFTGNEPERRRPPRCSSCCFENKYSAAR